MNFTQERRQGSGLGVPMWQRRAAVNPLVGVVVIDPDDIDQILTATQLWPGAAQYHVSRFELGQAVTLSCRHIARPRGIGSDMNERFGADEACLWQLAADCASHGNRGAGELYLEFGSPSLGERVEIGDIASAPGMEADFVNRTEPDIAIRRRRKARRYRAREGGAAG